MIEKDLPQTICGTLLMIIRIRSQKEVLPAYLNWYLNLPGTQMEIAALAAGKKVRTISIKAMAGLELPIPTLAVQQLIVAEDAKVRFALQHTPWKKEALAQSNAILLGLVGDERQQEANGHK